MPTGANERQSESQWERRQRRFVAFLLLLIPLAIPAGLFAPNLVAIVTTDTEPLLLLPPDEPRVALDHVPLLYRYHFGGGGQPKFFTARASASSRSMPPSVPEPGSGVLLGAGLIALAAQRRSVRRRRRAGVRSRTAS